MLYDRGGVVDHILDDLLGREDLSYLSGNPTGEPRPRTERLLGVLLEVLFDRDDTLFEESLGFGLTIILPNEKQINTRSGGRGASDIPIVNIGAPDHS